MKIAALTELIESYIDSFEMFQIHTQIFVTENGRKIYNKIIREKVRANSFGIYVWVNPDNEEVIYIGMAGKIKTNGAFCDHTLRDRLTASRGKDKQTKIDIQTNDYIKGFMIATNVDALDFYVFYTKEGEPPSYVEALLLYNYYKKSKRLPILNNAF